MAKLTEVKIPEKLVKLTAKVKKDGVMPVFFVVGVAAFLSGFWASGYAAKSTGYSPALDSWLIADNLYWPVAWFFWMFSDWSDPIKQQIAIRGLSPALVTFAVGMLVYGALNLRKSDYIAGLHGSARLANINDIEAAGLLNPSGVVVGGYEDVKGDIHPLTFSSGQHVLAFAPTGSGKGVALVLPTLLSWPDSAVVLDIKGENYNLSAGWRSKYLKSKVIRFDPASESSDGYNPLVEIRIGTSHEISDAQNVALMIVDSEGEGLKDHWDNTSFAFLQGLIIYECYKAKDEGRYPTIWQITNYLTDPERSGDELFEDMLGTGIHFVQQSARGMMNKPEKERGSVFSTAETRFTLYRDPIVSNNLKTPSFRIDELQKGDCPITLYIIVRPNDMERLKPITRLLFTQILERRLSNMTFKEGRSVGDYDYRLLMMLDEFTSQGKLEVVSTTIAFARSYGVMFYLIIQDIDQLTNRYGQNEEITGNCHVRVAFPPNKLPTAQLLSSMTGETTVERKTVTKSGSRTGVLNNVSESIDYVKRPLLTPDEILNLPTLVVSPTGEVKAGDLLVFVSGTPLIYGKQFMYFKNSVLTERSKVPPPNGAADEDDGLKVNRVEAPSINVKKRPESSAAVSELTNVSDANKSVLESKMDQIYQNIEDANYSDYFDNEDDKSGKNLSDSNNMFSTYDEPEDEQNY